MRSACRTRAGRNAVEITVGQHTLLQRRECHKSYTRPGRLTEHSATLHLAVEHIVTSLIEQTRHITLRQIVVGKLRRLTRPPRDARIQSLALTHHVDKSLQGLLERSLGVIAMRVKHVDILEIHASETLMERREEIFARAPVAIRSGPHVIAGLGGDKHLVAIGTERAFHHAAESLLGRAVGGAVIVGEVKARHAMVKGIMQHVAAHGQRIHIAEIMP